jgi:two-component system, cell cycle sensor histidine kinase and response regulator CckA
MSHPADGSSTRIITWLAGIVMVLLVVIFPLGYFAVSYHYTIGSLETEAEINSSIISQIISANPSMWQFEKVRIGEYLSRRPRKGHDETRRVFKDGNELVAESADLLQSPVIMRSHDLFDSGEVVGSLEVARSLRPLLGNTFLLGLLMVPFGVGGYLALSMIPIRTIRRKVEYALKKERDTAQQYLDIAGVILVAIDSGQKVTMINRKGCEVLEYPEEEIRHKNWFDNFVPLKQREEDREVFVQMGKGAAGIYAHMESPVLTIRGDVRVIDWRHIPLIDKDGNFTGMLSSGEDITERKSLESQLRHSQKMEAIGLLAGGVAHDFNNILSVITGYCSIMKLRMGDNDPQLLNLNQILDAAQRASSLTRSLLVLSRKEPVNPRQADLNDIITTVGKFIRRIIGEDILLSINLYEKLLDVNVDSGQIEQVMMNLSTNARDSMEKGGKLIITTSLKELDATFVKAHGYGTHGKYALVTISDTGYGMDENTRKRIFEPFYTTKDAGKGTGLGLSIVYGVIKQHSGFINVYSEPGEGTTFRIYLPLSKGKPAADEDIPVLPMPKGGSETILVAEDDDSVRQLVYTLLSEYGYKVILAEDGQDAVEKFVANRDKIRLVIMDIIMPRKSGKEAHDEIRRLDPCIKVLYVSGYTAEIIEARGQIEEGTELIAKPVEPLHLLRKIREILNR